MSKTPKSPAARAATPGLRARANLIGPRCNCPRSADGRPCRRLAGAGTDHRGVGPCANHDNGNWARPPFADDRDAQDAFLAAVVANPEAGIRQLIEPLGFSRRQVTDLLETDKDFDARYIEARGYDVDAIRNELKRRAMGDGSSDKLFEFLARLRLPEARELTRMRFDGRLEVQPVAMWDTSKLTLEEKRELRRLLEKARPDPVMLGEGQQPAVELVAAPDQSDPA